MIVRRGRPDPERILSRREALQHISAVPATAYLAERAVTAALARMWLVAIGGAGIIAETDACYIGNPTKKTFSEVLAQKDLLVEDRTYVEIDNVAVLPVSSNHYTDECPGCGVNGAPEPEDRTRITMKIYPDPVRQPKLEITGFEDKLLPFSKNQDPGIPEESNPEGAKDPSRIHRYNIRGSMQHNYNRDPGDENRPSGYYFEIDSATRL
jgi:hypothetical protein